MKQQPKKKPAPKFTETQRKARAKALLNGGAERRRQLEQKK